MSIFEKVWILIELVLADYKASIYLVLKLIFKNMVKVAYDVGALVESNFFSGCNTYNWGCTYCCIVFLKKKNLQLGYFGKSMNISWTGLGGLQG